MKRRIIPGEELKFAATRALALAHAALESKALSHIREAHKTVLGVLALVDERLCRGEIRQLIAALRTMSSTLGRLAAQPA